MSRGLRPRQGPGVVMAAVAALATACAGDVGSDRSGERDAVGLSPDSRPWAAGPWVEAVLEATSGDDVFLSAVYGIAVDSRGGVYVLDYRDAGVIALDADLTYGRTIGGRGEGPGEFAGASDIQVLPGDSLLVWDYQLQRITVFPPGSGEPGYVHALGTLESSSETRRFTGSGGYLARSSTTYNADGSDEGATRVEVLRHVREESGRIVDEVLVEYPANESLVFRREGFVSVGAHPFGRRSFVRIFAGERIVHARSDALDVRIIDLQGEVESGFDFPVTPIRVTGDELDRAVDETSRVLGDALREGAPYVWPALTGLVVDDEDRIWPGIRTADRSFVEWAAFTADGTHLMSVELPAEYEVHAVRGGRIIGVASDELDVPRVMAYRLR